MSEIKRVRDFEEGDFNCIRCGKKMRFWFNGGELDKHYCCGLNYETVHGDIDLVITDPEATHPADSGQGEDHD